MLFRSNKSCWGAICRGVEWLDRWTVQGTKFDPSPIGFYFAKLWYFEKHYPICYTVAVLERIAKLERDKPQELSSA